MAQLVSSVNFDDTGNNSIIEDNASNLSITTTGNLIFNPTGSVEFESTFNGTTSTTSIEGVTLIQGGNNNVLTLASRGTQSFVLRTNSVNRITMSITPGISFNQVPTCNIIPTLNTEFQNWNNYTNVKSYTPVITSGNGIVTALFSSRGGRYIQYGNLVWFTAFVNCSTLSNTVPSAALRISIPVALTTPGNIQSVTVGLYGGLKTTSDVANMYAQIAGGLDYLVIVRKSLGTSPSTTILSIGECDSDFSIVLTGTYYLF